MSCLQCILLKNKQVFKVHQTRFLSNGEKDGRKNTFLNLPSLFLPFFPLRSLLYPDLLALVDVPLWSIPVGIVTEKNPAVQFFLISHKYMLAFQLLLDHSFD